MSTTTTTPTPITREEFKAGVKFYLKDKYIDASLQTYYFDKEHFSIYYRNKLYYVYILSIYDDRFVFIVYKFDKKLEDTVFFKDCYKAD